jgi:uncharacterized protein
MKKVLVIAAAVIISLICAIVVIRRTSSATYGTGTDEKKASARFKYAGYSSPRYTGHDKKVLFVSMPDGVKLAVDVFIPAGGPAQKSFPVVFIYNPYDRSYINPHLKWWERAYMWVRYGLSGNVFDQMIYDENRYLVSHGYAIVVADMRGTGASFGSQMPFELRVGTDGKELVDWIARQEWCDGNVGMLGLSYRGWGQLVTAKYRPRALKCIMPEVIALTGYTEGFRPGGIAARRWIETYSDYLNAWNMNIFHKNLPFPLAKNAEAPFVPTTPVVDEDGDGDLADEVPLMDRGDPSTFADDGPPRYGDGLTRKDNLYYHATMEHRKNGLFKDLAKLIPFIDSRVPSANGEIDPIDSSPGYFAKDIMASGIPVYNIGGWFDGFVKGTVQIFATMRPKNPSRLLIGPKFHLPGVPPAYADLFGYSGNLKEQTAIERLRFFDRYLKGIKNGIDSEPPVCIYVMNSGWREEREWPLKRQVITPFYLAGGKALSTGKGPEGSDDYRVDFTHSSSYGANDMSRYLMMFTPDGLMERTVKDRKCLTYETGPLAADTEVTGHPVADLWVSSNRSDGDFYAYLVDVDEHGRALYVTEGQLRAGWHRTCPDDDQARGAVNVLPDLPWHGYKNGTYEKESLAGGRVINLRFDLLPTSWVFRKGHRIRVTIAGADYPDFELNPALSPSNDPAKALETVISLHRSDRYPSRIELPVIPAGR